MRESGSGDATEPHASGRVGRALSRARPRNTSLVDVWSFIHLGTCAGLALLFGPLLGWLVALAWEPLEVLILSPWLANHGIDFGHEDLKNSVSDIAFNSGGVVAGMLVIEASGWVPPFAIF